MLSQEIARLRKSGELRKAWDIGCKAVKENPTDTYLKRAFFWVCYDYLKAVQVSIKARAERPNGNHNLLPDEIDRVNIFLDWIIWLNIPPGGFEYRSLVVLFQQNLEGIPRLVLLLFRVGLSLFDKEQGDNRPYEGEKGESFSLMLQFARKTAQSWRHCDEAQQIPIEKLLQLFEQVREEVFDRQNLIWLDYDEAKCLILAGKLEQARECALRVLRKKQTESWAWGTLATTYSKQEPEVAIILLAKGLTHVREESFALGLLKDIAPLLASQGFEDQASMCLQRAVNCCQANSWSIKADLEKLLQQPWFNGNVEVGDLPSFLQQRSEGALSYLHGPTVQCVAIVMNIHKSGKGFHVYRDQEHRYSVRLGLLSSKSLPELGSYIRLTLSAEDDSVVSAEPCLPAAIPDVGFAEGNIRLAARGYGFVGDTFVPPNLISEGIDGQLVKVVHILDFDKAKNRPGWKALTLEVI